MFSFAIKNMWIKKVKVLLVVLSIVISASVGLLAYNVSRQVRDGILSTAAYYDMIVGPSGSSTQLAMNTMFFTDTPLGTIPYAYVTELEQSGMTNAVVPFTMGDSYNGSRIVGTTPVFLNGKPVADGRMFETDTLYEAVIGSSVAAKHHLRVGDTMVTSHGLSEMGHAHAASPLMVVGILDSTQTAYDNTVFTSYKTVWAVHGLEDHGHEDDHEDHHDHEDHDEDHDHAEDSVDTAPGELVIDEGFRLTHDAVRTQTTPLDAQIDADSAPTEATAGTVCAILVKAKSLSDQNRLATHYGADASLLVINPATVLREVLENVDLSSQIVYLLCIIILIMNLFVISVITLLNLYDSRKEIALMRLIGVSMRKINALFLIQNGIIGIFSTILALVLSRLCLSGMGGLVASMGIVLNAMTLYPFEWVIMAVVFVISVLPTLVCTLRMAQKDSIGS